MRTFKSTNRFFATPILIAAAVLLLPLTASAQMFSEAPMLAAKVAAGELPPVDERIPSDPFVREVAVEIGDYGGTLRVDSGAFYYWPQFFYQGERVGLFQVPMWADGYAEGGGIGGGGLEPKYGEWYRWSDGGRTLTLKIREGARWSDGEPLTVEDMIFPFESLYSHPELVGDNIPFQAGMFGEKFTVEKIDDLTVSFSLSQPWFTTGAGPLAEGYPQPAHYFKRYHPDFSDGSWDDLAGARTWKPHVGRPVLYPWMPVEVDETAGVLWERNPYYAVVDGAGNQLPYVDYIRVSVTPDLEARFLQAIQGNIDIGSQEFQDLGKFSLLKQREEQGDFEVVIWSGSRQPSMVRFDWPAAQDENFKNANQHKEFRQALSVAIDRDELNEKLFLGLATPSVSGLPQSSPFYDPVQDTFLGPDLDKARELLDSIGIRDRDGDGILEYENGDDVHILVGAQTTYPLNVETSEALMAEWEQLGIKTTLVAAAPVTLGEKMANLELGVMTFGGPHPEPLPTYYLGDAYNPIRRGGQMREQPAEYDRAHELENQMATATTLDEWRVAVREYFNYTSTDALQFIHFVTDRPAMVIRHNRMGNIPDEGFYWKALILSKSDQYFIREGMQ